MATDWEKLDEEYEEAEEVKAPEDVPDGKYQVYVHAISLKEKEDSNPMVTWDLIVISLISPYVGRHIFKNQFVSGASMPYIKGDLQLFGYPGPVSGLREKEVRGDFLDTCLEITKRTNKKSGYTNIYFNKVIEVDLDEIKSTLKEGFGQADEEEEETRPKASKGSKKKKKEKEPDIVDDNTPF